jgi:hypothetical protein
MIIAVFTAATTFPIRDLTGIFIARYHTLSFLIHYQRRSAVTFIVISQYLITFTFLDTFASFRTGSQSIATHTFSTCTITDISFSANGYTFSLKPFVPIAAHASFLFIMENFSFFITVNNAFFSI